MTPALAAIENVMLPAGLRGDGVAADPVFPRRRRRGPALKLG